MKAILTAGMILAAGVAQAQQAQQACAPRAGIVSQLHKKYGETRQGAGLDRRGVVTEIYASATTGTWTIIVTRPDGVACAVAAGEAWIEGDALSAAPGDPS